MVSIFRYSEISEANASILNPLSESKLLQLGDICRLSSGMTQLDLACGKGEMICRFADRHGISGNGIDIYPPFIEAARQRAAELGVSASVTFQVADAASESSGASYDLVSCIGATWIGGGLPGTLELMKPRLSPGGSILVGEVFWAAEPDPDLRREQEALQSFSDLAGTLERIEAAGLELAEMVLANQDDWDRYQSSQWLAAHEWIAANPDDPDVEEIGRMTAEFRRAYLSGLRSVMGWGVFVLKEA